MENNLISDGRMTFQEELAAWYATGSPMIATNISKAMTDHWLIGDAIIGVDWAYDKKDITTVS